MVAIPATNMRTAGISTCQPPPLVGRVALHVRSVHIRIARMHRRFIALIGAIFLVSLVWWWLHSAARMDAPPDERVVTARSARPIAAPPPTEQSMRPMLPPAIQLARPVVLRAAPPAAPGALEDRKSTRLNSSH